MKTYLIQIDEAQLALITKALGAVDATEPTKEAVDTMDLLELLQEDLLESPDINGLCF